MSDRKARAEVEVRLTDMHLWNKEQAHKAGWTEKHLDELKKENKLIGVIVIKGKRELLNVKRLQQLADKLADESANALSVS